MITDAQRNAIKEWCRVIKQRSEVGERGLYGEFQRCVLEDLLDYDRNSIYLTPNKNVDSKETDFKIKGETASIFIEAKELNTKLDEKQYRANERHETPIAQLWDYMNNTDPPIEYGICTNYVDFWLFTRTEGKNKTHKFSLKDALDNDDKLREFIWAFNITITNNLVSKLHAESIKYDQDITERFYKLFHDTRTRMIKEFSDGDPDAEDAATSTVQTFLNRIVFVFFAEDLKLADRRMVDAINDALRNSTSTSSFAYDTILNLFDSYNKGRDDIPEFNGGLFERQIDRNVRFLDHDTNGNASQIITNILEMGTYNFETELTVNILGHIFEQSISDLDRDGKDERKSEGIYYTPDQITEHICNSTIVPYLSKSGTVTNARDLVDEYAGELDVLNAKLRSIRVLDPACGSGAFLVKAVETILEIHRLVWEARGTRTLDKWVDATMIREIILQNIYGVDKSADSVGITKLALFLKTAQKGKKLPSLDGNIKVGNSLIRDKSVVSNALDWEAEFPDVVNSIDPDDFGFDVIIGNPPYIRQEALVEFKPHMQLPNPNNLGTVNFKIPAKADLSSYFYYHSVNLLKDGGRLGFITSDSWMHMKYGHSQQRFFLDHSTINSLLRTVSNVFDDAQTKTAIITLTRSAPDPLNSVSILLADNPHDMETVKEQKVPQSNMAVGNWNLLFMEQEYEPRVDMVSLGSTGQLKRGTTTGCNKFFVLTHDVIAEYNIPRKYTKPLFHKNIHGGLLQNSDATVRALDVRESKGSLAKTESGRKVLKYIETGETTMVEPGKSVNKTPRPISKLSTPAARNPWYSVKWNPPAPIFLGRFSHKYMKMYENNGRFYALDNCACFTPNDLNHAHAFLSYFMSSLFLLQLERHGHEAGGGALQLHMHNYVAARAPDFNAMPEKDVNRMKRAWLDYREDFDREKLDGVVLDALGFDESERQEIREKLEEKIKARVEKTQEGGNK